MNLVVGMDVGGTKLAVRAETVTGETTAAAEFDARGWEAVPAAAAASWLLRHLTEVVPDLSRVSALAVGAQGCDAPPVVANLQRELESRGLRATVVNDGALLVPAAGLTSGIGIVAGTGSIGVGADPAGRTLLAGGWGWVLGDEGGAAAIVREAAKAALAAYDEAETDDGLLTSLQRAFGVPSAERLARAVNDDPTVANWAPRAAAVFAAADAGSALAEAVIDTAAEHLTILVGRLLARGAVGGTVVAAGRVIVRQPRLARAFRDHLASAHPHLDLLILDTEPVTGAVALARRLLGRETTVRSS